MTFNEAVDEAHKRLGVSTQETKRARISAAAAYPDKPKDKLGELTIPAGKEEQIIASMIVIFLTVLKNPHDPALAPLGVPQFLERIRNDPPKN